jgi:hypothetical protein
VINYISSRVSLGLLIVGALGASAGGLQRVVNEGFISTTKCRSGRRWK